MPTKSLGSKKPTVIVRKKRTALPPSGVARSHSEASPAPSRQPHLAKAHSPRSSRPPVEPRTTDQRLATQAKAAAPSPAVAPPAPQSLTASQPSRKERDVQQQRALLLLLQQRWPQLFPTDVRRRTPLAVGIHQELIAALPDVKPWRIRQLLGWWQWSGQGAYWRALLRGGPRYRLDGTPSGEVTVQEQEHARQQLAAITQRKRARRPSPPSSYSEAAELQPPRPAGKAQV